MSKLRNSMMVTGWWCAGVSAANAAAATGYMTPQSAALGGIAAIAIAAAAISRRNLRLAREEHTAAVYQASHDALTSLPNRVAFMQRLSRMLQDDGEAAVIFLDLDGFKSINDVFGHAVGDEFLKNGAARLRYAAGDGHLIARVGGDEFAIAVAGPNARQLACKIASNITECMQKPIECDGRDLCAGASLGIACGSRADVTPQELLKRADIAMYEAKRVGGNTWEIFNSKLAASRKRFDELFCAMRQAVYADEPLPLLYEPVTLSAASTITAARPVLKWPAPMEDAANLMHVAAHQGFGCDLLHNILERACAETRQLPALRLCVPATAQQLLAPDFENRIETTFIRQGADPACIEFQLHASQISTLSKRRCRELMQRLAARGLQFSLKGFGEGKCDISLLGQSPFKRLVLHESLTSRISHDVTAQQIIQGIGAIARAHGIQLCAEGVDSHNDAKLLRLAGISEFSGGYAGLASTSDELKRRLTIHPYERAASA
jgi:diguanylate cyclase (GGDEF)-like protein